MSTMTKARELEQESRLSEAVEAYLKVIAKDPINAAAYNRVMILYRKLKEPRKELQIINQAIKAYEDDVLQQYQQFAKSNKKAAKLSKTLAAKLGLVDKKGLPVYEEQIEKWRKRKQTVSKKLYPSF